MKSKTLQPYDSGYHTGHLPNSPEVQRAQEIAIARRTREAGLVGNTLSVPCGHVATKILELLEAGTLDYIAPDGQAIQPFQATQEQEHFSGLRQAICEYFRFGSMDDTVHTLFFQERVRRLYPEKLRHYDIEYAERRRQEITPVIYSHFGFSEDKQVEWKVEDIWRYIDALPDTSNEQKNNFREDTLTAIGHTNWSWGDLSPEEKSHLSLNHEDMLDFLSDSVIDALSIPREHNGIRNMQEIQKRLIRLVIVSEDMIQRFSGRDDQGVRNRIARYVR